MVSLVELLRETAGNVIGLIILLVMIYIALRLLLTAIKRAIR